MAKTNQHSKPNQRACRNCHVCGKVAISLSKRGRIKDAHTDCIELQSRFNQLETLLMAIRFTPEKRKVMKGDLFALSNEVKSE